MTNTSGIATKYCGKVGPDGVVAIGTIKWHSDYSGDFGNYGGWRICFGVSSPMSPPPPSSPLTQSPLDAVDVSLSAPGTPAVAGPCKVSATEPNCVESSGYSSSGGGYSSNEKCEIDGYPEEPITVQGFDVEDNNCIYDFLEVAGTKYCGTNGPAGVVASGVIKWESDYDGDANYGGWKICFGVSSPTQSPLDAIDVPLTANGTPAVDATNMGLIGGGIAVSALLVLLFLARKVFNARKALKPARSLPMTAVSPVGAASASLPGAPLATRCGAAAGKDVLLDSVARHRAGLSWFKPVQVQLLTAPADDGMSDAPPWSTLVVDGVAVPYEEVARVRMDESVFEFIVERHPPRVLRAQDDPPRQHLRMYTRCDFNLWREALDPKINIISRKASPVGLHTQRYAKTSSAVDAALMWLEKAEAN